MLMRVTTALVRFLSPLATSLGSQNNPREKSQEKDFLQKNQIVPPESLAQNPSVPEPSSEPEALSSPQEIKKQVPEMILELLALRQKNPITSQSKLNLKIYQLCKSSKKSGKFRKGAMIDEKVD
jgi:hypothetical protein